MNFPSANVLIQVTVVGLLTGGVYALLASGLTLIFGVMRVINIAHGAFLVFGAYFSYWLYTLYGLDPMLSIFISVPVFFLMGIGIQRYLLSRAQSDHGLTVLFTFALALTLEGIMGTLWQSTGRTVRTDYSSAIVHFDLATLTLRLPVVRIIGFVAALVALGLLYLLITRSDLGRAIRATIQNPAIAQLMGVNVGRVQAMTFAVGLATVAIGGALFSMIWTFNGSSHWEWIAKMLSIVVLGGMGSLPGALLASLLMGSVESVAAVTLTTYLSPIIFYLILFLTLIFRPQGLLGSRVREG